MTWARGEAGGVLVNDGPVSGVWAVPEVVVLRVLGDLVLGFVAEIGDGTGFGGAEGASGVFLLVFGHRFGEVGAEVERVFEVDGLEREAALLVVLADVDGGESCGFWGRVVNDGNADAVAVANERGVERGLLLELTDGGVISVSDDGIGLGQPVRREGARGGDVGLEAGWDSEVL